MSNNYRRDFINIDLDSGHVVHTFLSQPLGRDDRAADRFGCRCYRNGEAVDISSCTCMGYFRDAMGNNIVLNTGHIGSSGNLCYVYLTAACYNYEGPFSLAIKLIDNDRRITLRIIEGTIHNTWTDDPIAPTDTVPTYQEVIAQYDQMVKLYDDLQDYQPVLDRIVKYVNAGGSDDNNGDGPAISGTVADKAYATIGKAISVGARTIYVAKGTYNEQITNDMTEGYRYGDIRIIGNRATVAWTGGTGMTFRFCNVYISGIDFVISEPSGDQTAGLFLLWCTGTVTDCTASGAKIGFRLDGSRMTFIRCKAFNNIIDGFNGHNQTIGGYTYETEATLINCEAYGNGDDGASIHEHGTLNIIGGWYHDNVSAGIAPWNWCHFEILNAKVTGNGTGIEINNPSNNYSADDKGNGKIIGCIIANNNKTGRADTTLIGIGVSVRRYIVDALGNAVTGNTTAGYSRQQDADLTVYTATTE